MIMRPVFSRLQPSRWRLGKRTFSSSANNHDNNNSLTLFISCVPGLEPTLKRELMALEIPHTIVQGGANVRNASVDTIQRCHLHLGSASHVLLRCGRKFRAKAFSKLSQTVAKMPWSKWLPEDAVPEVKSVCNKSKLYHSDAVSQRVAKSIDKSFGRTDPQQGPSVPIHVRIDNDIATISINTSATPLHRRGYRFETAKAPLREDLAFSMLYAGGWTNNKDNMYDGLIDPMCGAGTIAVEGVAMKLGLPPGRLREAPLSGTVFYDPTRYQELLDEQLRESEKAVERLKDVKIACVVDRDEGAVLATNGNAERAGVLKFMDIACSSMTDAAWFKNPKEAPKNVLVATNPPFGKRIVTSRNKKSERMNQLLPLYQSLKTCTEQIRKKGRRKVSAAILTNNIALPRAAAFFKTKALFTTQHGGQTVIAVGSNIKGVEQEESTGETKGGDASDIKRIEQEESAGEVQVDNASPPSIAEVFDDTNTLPVKSALPP